jgi:hypothetical protein
MKARFALPIFLGSALLFCIQPMLGRALLPVFGGTASVWTACLVTFQMLFVAGAVYADWMGRERRGKCRRRIAHIAALAVSALWIMAFAHFRPELGALVPDSGDVATETASALMCVLAAVGFPYVILSSGSSLVQKWAEESLGEGRETYRLYMVSNIGSFAGLLAYPLLLEPFAPQTWLWRGFAAALALYATLCAVAGLRRRCECTEVSGTFTQSRREGGGAEIFDGVEPVTFEKPGDSASSAPLRDKNNLVSRQYAQYAIWLALPALSTFLLDATTTHLSSDVSPFPLMWVALLGMFLMSYAIGFSRIGEKLLPVWFALASASVLFAIAVLRRTGGPDVAFVRNFTAGSLVILFGGSFLHGWLCRLRPDGSGLTRYYLCIAIGGAAGGFAGGLAPVLLFDTVAEYPVGLFLLVFALVTTPCMIWRGVLTRAIRSFRPDAQIPLWTRVLCMAGLILAAGLTIWVRTDKKMAIYECGRSFHGCWMVARDFVVTWEGVPPGMKPPTFPVTMLASGNTKHGVEAEDEVWRGLPTTYYGVKAGGLAFSLHPNYAETNTPLRVGIVGMGAGTQAWYGRPGDFMRFFEIDPAIVSAARRYFTFLKDCKALTDIVVADARKALERETRSNERKYDILVIDAYSGDSVPFHLLTAEAFDLYASRLESDGILALHISNWHIDLRPVCKAAASRLGFHALGITSLKDSPFSSNADWVFLSREALGAPQGVVVYDWGDVRDIPLPTDDKGSILPYVHFRR